mmetsp:Transcript_69963/g.192032  ORF Transcript_69963/g.192032 Transcript_69963/m.192032 type:complete len:429 (+) Transcript_69963:238-1524(+)
MLGCESFVDATAGCASVPVKELYGSGGWSGVQCWRDVKLGSLVVPNYELSATTAESNFLTCKPSRLAEMLRSDFRSEGILGLSLDGLAHASNTSMLLMDALFAANPTVPRVFGLQCCAYDAVRATGGSGAFDIGGAEPSHFHGALKFAQVIGNKWWGGDLIGVRVGASGPLLRNDNGPSTAYSGSTRNPKHIVDSGTSNLVIRRRTYEAIIGALADSLGDSAPPVTHGFWNGSDCAAVDLDRLPPLELTLRGEVGGDDAPVLLTLPSSRYARRQRAADCRREYGFSGPDGVYTKLEMEPGDGAANGILGQPVFEEYYVLHETPAHPSPPRMGFAPIAGCGTPSEGTQQQRTATLLQATSPLPSRRVERASSGLSILIIGLVALPGMAFGATMLRAAPIPAVAANEAVVVEPGFLSRASAPLLASPLLV